MKLSDRHARQVHVSQRTNKKIIYYIVEAGTKTKVSQTIYEAYLKNQGYKLESKTTEKSIIKYLYI